MLNKSPSLYYDLPIIPKIIALSLATNVSLLLSYTICIQIQLVSYSLAGYCTFSMWLPY